MNTCGVRHEADPTNKWKAQRRNYRTPDAQAARQDVGRRGRLRMPFLTVAHGRSPRPTAGQLGRTTGVASWESTQEGYARSLTLASQ